MQLGTPVITSTKGSTPEVAGDAALMVDPYDVPAIAGAIRRFEADADLRDHYAQAGTAQAAKFSNAAYDARLADLYRKFA
ncbi:Glycosyl transferases group 1 [Methylobrevis pamukkalensis]|uniref:Glycosyl transferases group 1 n=2 Tax=Methylobrevis pamukkalensis TaxID=1439726 RepID=A0A1E3GZQ6_9HYPH|nr:Glycosyl transferases group 1 [Methylobrevis pamukkalensis]